MNFIVLSIKLIYRISHPATSLTANVSNMTKDLIKDLQLLPSGMTETSVKNINCTPQELAKICW